MRKSNKENRFFAIKREQNSLAIVVVISKMEQHMKDTCGGQ